MADHSGAGKGRYVFEHPSAVTGVNLAARARAIAPRAERSPWDGYEYARGYGVLNLPFDSGHLLGLRVFPENDFAPYVSV